MGTGAALAVEGELVVSPGGKQKVELKAKKLTLVREEEEGVGRGGEVVIVRKKVPRRFVHVFCSFLFFFLFLLNNNYKIIEVMTPFFPKKKTTLLSA